MSISDITIVRKSFSKASSAYELHALLQQRIGERLWEKIKAEQASCHRILDIGMGTGWLSEKIASHYKIRVFGIDSAFGMAHSAKHKKQVVPAQAEAEHLPFQTESFSAVVSNLAFQWVRDLSQVFSEVGRVLQPGGVFYFTCFGPQTLQELRQSFGASQPADCPQQRLTDKDKIYSLLARQDFKHITIDAHTEREFFSDLFSLAKWLKNIGAHRVSRPRFINRQAFFQANEFYKREFRANGKVYATFEVIEVSAVSKSRI